MGKHDIFLGLLPETLEPRNEEELKTKFIEEVNKLGGGEKTQVTYYDTRRDLLRLGLIKFVHGAGIKAADTPRFRELAHQKSIDKEQIFIRLLTTDDRLLLSYLAPLVHLIIKSKRPSIKKGQLSFNVFRTFFSTIKYSGEKISPNIKAQLDFGQMTKLIRPPDKLQGTISKSIQLLGSMPSSLKKKYHHLLAPVIGRTTADQERAIQKNEQNDWRGAITGLFAGLDIDFSRTGLKEFKKTIKQEKRELRKGWIKRIHYKELFYVLFGLLIITKISCVIFGGKSFCMLPLLLFLPVFRAELKSARKNE